MKQEKKKEIVYSIGKALAGSIPVVGAATSELLQLLITPPLEKRRNEWMSKIGEKLLELEKNTSLDLEELKENEIFADVVLQTTQQALKTSEEEKIKYYQNAILNTAISETPDLSEIQIFLNLISEFTVWHIKILSLFDAPTEWFDKNKKKVPNYTMSGLSSILIKAYPELQNKRDFYNLIWNDLERAGLHQSGSLNTTMSRSSLMASRTSPFGKRFLSFISENPN